MANWSSLFVVTSFLLLSTVESVVREYHPPILNYDKVFLDVPVKDNFTVHCYGRYPLEWKLPAMWKILIEERTHITTNYDSSKANPYESTLLVHDLQSTDTGLYSCHYENITDFQDKANVTSIYLFANDPEYLFVQDKQWGFTLFPPVLFGPESVIPCLTTHSNTNVTLIKVTDYGDEVIPFDENLEFNPMRGMILRYPTSKFSGLFSCKAEHYGKVKDMSLYMLYYGDTPNAPEPVIERIGSHHAIVNEPFKLRCAAQASFQASIDMRFEYPARGSESAKSRIKESDLMVDSQQVDPLGFSNVYTDLEISKLLPEDQGIYKCVASDHMQKTGVTETYVEVLNLKPPAYVNLTTDIREPIKMLIGTKDVQFVVKYNVYPSREEVEFIWRKDNEVLDDKRHIVSELLNSSQIILKIKKLTLEDTGSYVLQAKTKDTVTNITITLLVTEKPLAKIISTIKHMESGKSYELLCGAFGSPKPTVWWTWLPCINQSLCHGEFLPHEQQTYLDPSEMDDRFDSGTNKAFTAGSILNVEAKTSGYYKCHANNMLGSDSSDDKRIIVSDAAEGLDIIQTKDDPVEQDNVTLICRANMYEFSNLKWYWIPLSGNKSDVKPILASNAEVANATQTYKLSLFLKNTRPSDSGTYICSAIYRDEFMGGAKNITSILKVRAMEAPVMNSTNLVGKTLYVKKTKEFEFYCYADGVPKPRVLWFKNQLPFNITGMPGVVMIDDGQKIIINRLVESDTGDYMCRIQNRVGHLQAKLGIKVGTGVADPITNGEPPGPMVTGMIVGIILIVILFIVVGGILARRMYKDRKLKLDLELEGFKNFDQGRLDMYNPDLPLDDQAELLPYDKRWEFPKERLILGKTLGQGAFGRVVQAAAIGISDYENSTTVAVKMLKEKSDKTQLKALIAELKIMIHLGKHLNVVNLLGAVTKNIAKGELMVLAEYCKYGNLRHYLLHQRRNFIDQISIDTGEIDINIISQSSVIGKNRKNSVRTTENDQVEKQLHYADIVHAYKRGLSRERSRNSENESVSRSASNSVKSHFIRSGSNGSNSIKYNNMHKAVLERSISAGTDATVSINLSRLGSANSETQDEILSDNTASGDVFSQSGMSYMCKGDLKDIPVTTCDLLCFSFQIARGMEYLSSKKLIHRDLAARNILLAEDNVVKICDFGLAKDCYKYSNYVKKGDGPLPIKWMAIESIRDKVFTTQTDVWSYAILLWEIFTLGGNPYPGIEVDEEFFKKLRNGYRMEKPEFCPNSLFKLIEDCWEAEPHDRPKFPEIAERMGDLLEGSMKQYYIELNNPFELMNEEMQNNNDYLSMEGKDRDSNYLNMRGSTNSDSNAGIDDQTGHYDNIGSVRPVGTAKGEEIILKPPMEVVPMIQFSDEGNVKLTNYQSDNKSLPKPIPKKKCKKDIDNENHTHQLTDYIYMGSPKRKEFTDNPFANIAKKGDSSTLGANSDIPPSYTDAIATTDIIAV